MTQASIRQISQIKPIEGADRVQIAMIDGWQCVVGKDNGYHEGDLCVFIEIDSFVPFNDALGRYDFLKDKNGKIMVYNGVPGARIKTIKLRKQISQGLTLPLNRLNGQWLFQDRHGNESIVIGGEDVTGALGIQHWEKPVPAQLAGTVRSTFPKFIPKTDQERAQNLTGTLKDFLKEEFECTIKLDGSSMTVYVCGEDAGVCSRNMNLVEDDTNAYWKVANKYSLIEKMRKYQGAHQVDIALQGELMGPGVQGNYDDLPELDFFVFDVFNITEQRYFLPDERLNILDEIDPEGIIKHVPFPQWGPVFFWLDEFLDEEGLVVPSLLNFADGESLNRTKKREGLVFKHRKSPFSFKVINNEFLLTNGE
jgi:RNA ligase (TIGR02306 family)